MTERETKQIEDILGKGATFLEFKDVKEFDAAKVVEAKKNGELWMKSKLDVMSLNKSGTDLEKEFESCGNGLDVYSKVYTLRDGTIVAVK